ncbi:permease prefix domain 1-containing protein [Plantactinospora solaniradicis]|uniref:Permease prefix domain 1-containing protein n=1 Tax=Plantactinospora solaniradicis TaxID=1723736 RepID=A0ABW1K2I0_9ACTN
MTAAIDDYVSEVGSGLRGSARLRADMLTEIRDALVDAAESHQRDGAGTPEAERLAVLEFGSARRIAAGLQDVLAVDQARRTAGLLLAALGTQFVTTELMGRVGGWQQLWGTTEPGAAYLWLARATDVFSGFAITTAVVTVVLLRWGLRHVGVHLVVARLTAVLASVVIGTTLLCGGLLTVLPPQGGGAGLLAGGLGWLTLSALVLASAWHCWHAAAPHRERELRSPHQLVGS